MTLENIGIQIRNLREENKLSQEDLANKCQIDRAQLSKIEQGLIQGVQFITIQKIFDALGYQIVPNKIDKENQKYALHPFVKWAGGKTQLLNIITENMPKQFNTYFEPFVGGGALLFKVQPKNFYINDINDELIKAYKCFQNKHSFNKLKELLEDHEKKHDELYFNELRNVDRDNKFKEYSYEEIAARLVYLNKSCFNGLYRVNSKGFFNVPSGKKKSVNAFDRTSFENIFKYFQSSNPHITKLDFAKAVQNAKKGDFVYFDPPYDTLNKNTFTAYDPNGFNKDEQKRLSDVYKHLSEKGVYAMLSNHDTPFIRELYKGFKFIPVMAKRSINSIGSKRGNVAEVLIVNY